MATQTPKLNRAIVAGSGTAAVATFPNTLDRMDRSVPLTTPPESTAEGKERPPSGCLRGLRTVGLR